MSNEVEVRKGFSREVHRALVHLYDPAVLRRSLLIRLLDLDRFSESASALRDVLNRAIESLRPNWDVPVDSNAWRLYNILYYRFAEQNSQAEVARELSISVRQLRRQEKQAIELLAGYLWNKYHLKADEETETNQVLQLLKERSDSHTPSLGEELAWVEKSSSIEAIEVQVMCTNVIQMMQSLLEQHHISVTTELAAPTWKVLVKPIALRQALVNLLTIAATTSPGSTISITAIHYRKGWLCLQVDVRGVENKNLSIEKSDIQLVDRLIRLCKGVFNFSNAPFKADLFLPTVEPIQVWIMDDNADTRNLVHRYLAGSRYQSLGFSDPQSLLRAFEDQIPDLLLLDVMLPGMDGWELLGRIKAHPGLSNLPVIVTTILSQEPLAMSLGAADFLRKPITAEKLLQAFDRQLELLVRKSLPITG